jgi:predicted transcriptional regulator
MQAYYTPSIEKLLSPLDRHQREVAIANIEAILAYLHKLANRRMRFYVSMRKIAERTGVNLTTVHKWLNRLHTAGVITITKVGNWIKGLANTYFVQRVNTLSNKSQKKKDNQDENNRERQLASYACHNKRNFVVGIENQPNENNSIYGKGLLDLPDLPPDTETNNNNSTYDKMMEALSSAIKKNFTRSYKQGDTFLARSKKGYHPEIEDLVDRLSQQELADYIEPRKNELRNSVKQPSPERRGKCYRCNSQLQLKVNLAPWTPDYCKLFLACKKCGVTKKLGNDEEYERRAFLYSPYEPQSVETEKSNERSSVTVEQLQAMGASAEYLRLLGINNE